MTADDPTVRIPSDVWAKCEARIEGTEFDSVEEYVQFVMTALLDGDEDRANRRMSEGDSTEVTERLESLGYL